MADDDPAQEPEPTRRKPRRWAWAAVFALLAAAGSAVLLLRPDSAQRALTGTVTVRVPSDQQPGFAVLRTQRSPLVADGAACDGAFLSSGYSDITGGASVTVKDETGRIIATASLDPGGWTSVGCALRFTVRPVPKAKFYAVEVSHRGEQRYSATDLEERGWHVELTLGS